MDGMDITIIATINIVTLATTVYYLKGKIEQMNQQYRSEKEQLLRYIDSRFNDLKEYVKDRIDDIQALLGTRVKNLEEIVLRND